MNCERSRELFSDYLEGTMDAALAAVIRLHLDKCGACASEFEQFKATWGILSVLPEIESPRDFRHDVVMRAVRQQHERAQTTKKNSYGIDWDQIISRLIPARPIAIAFAAAALAFVLLKFPDTVYHEFTGMFNPRAGVSQQTGSTEQPASSQPTPMQMSAQRLQDWQMRKLARNTVWVSIAPKDDGDGSAQYSVTLSINEDAFFAGEDSKRLPAQVYLLPSSFYEAGSIDSSAPIWSGNILEDSPVVVPVLAEEFRGKATTVKLLITWDHRDRKFGYVVFIPTRRSTTPGEAMDFSAGGRDFAESQSSLYAALEGMSEDYGVPMIVNAYLNEKPSVINLGRESLRSALTQALKSTDMDWMYADGAVYVDHNYSIK